jgi:iron complex transport system substrate-binding protein
MKGLFAMHKKSPCNFLAAILALALVLGACTPASPAAPNPQPTAVPTAATSATPTLPAFTDGLDRTVVLPGRLERIVSLAPSNTEILFAAGAGAQVVGRDEFSDYPAEAKDLPSVGGSMGKYDLEKIASLEPDLVLAAGLNPPELVKAISDLGVTVYYLPNPTDLQGLYDNLRVVGDMTGHGPQAAGLVDELKERVSAVESRLEGAEARPVVFYELDGSDPSRPYTAGPGTFIDLLISLAGGQNAAGKLSTSWGQLSLEEILVANPDLILLGDAAYGVTPESVAQRAGWESLKAVQEDRVVPFDDNLASRPTHRLIDGLETLARLVHPELFE